MTAVRSVLSRSAGSVCGLRMANSAVLPTGETAESNINNAPRDAPSRTDGSGTNGGGGLSVAAWNIQCGRNGGLESACRALVSLDVDIAILQETKLTNNVYARRSSGYSIIASDAPSASQGGVALAWREGGDFEVEETKIWGPNVLAFRLITGGADYYVVGCYIPPSDLATLEQVKAAWAHKPCQIKTRPPSLASSLFYDLMSTSRDEPIRKTIELLVEVKPSANLGEVNLVRQLLQ